MSRNFWRSFYIYLWAICEGIPKSIFFVIFWKNPWRNCSKEIYGKRFNVWKSLEAILKKYLRTSWSTEVMIKGFPVGVLDKKKIRGYSREISRGIFKGTSNFIDVETSLEYCFKILLDIPSIHSMYINRESHDFLAKSFCWRPENSRTLGLWVWYWYAIFLNLILSRVWS